MAFDTKNKRISVIEWDSPWEAGLPDPDSSFSQADRQQLLLGLPTILWQDVLNVPILTKIVNTITDLINAYMLQSNGFSQDYGSINEYIHDDRTYPAVFYEYPESEDLGIDRDVENRYSEETEFTIRVISPTGSDLEVIIDRTISDFKKLFAEFQKTLKVQGLIDYRYLGCEREKRFVKAYPLNIKMRFMLKYRRIMDDIFTVDPQSTAETFSGSAWASPTPVWNTIISQIQTNIGNMTIANGYVNDYGSVNQYIPGSRTYPAVFLEYPEEIGIVEEDNYISAYNCTNILTIKIIGETSSDLDKTALIYRSDFNKMFNDERESLEGYGLDESEWLGSTKYFKSVKLYPVVIELRYMLHFTTQKKNPYLT